MNQGMSEALLREALLRSAEYAIKNPAGGLTLHVEGNRFVNARGQGVSPLGAIVCCEAAKDNGWPLVTLPVLDLFAAHRLNYTHCRLGPFTVAGEGDPIYVGYVTVPDGRADLEQFSAPFWSRGRDIVARARQLSIYVEFDLVDRWVRQHGATPALLGEPMGAQSSSSRSLAGSASGRRRPSFRSASLPCTTSRSPTRPGSTS